MFRNAPILTLALVWGMTACQADGPLTPTPDTSAADVTTTLDVAPPSSRGIVSDDEVVFFFAHFDAARGLMSVHANFVTFCAEEPFAFTSRTIVTTPSQIAQRLVKLGDDNQPVVIYRTNTGALTCDLVNSPEVRVASGFVHHEQTFTLASFQATWWGTVTAPDGSSHPYSEKYQLSADIHDPNNPDLWSLNASQILIH